MGAVLLVIIMGAFTSITIGIASILIMIFGWGVEPKSWLIIIVGYTFTSLFTILMGFISAIIDPNY